MARTTGIRTTLRLGVAALRPRSNYGGFLDAIQPRGVDSGSMPKFAVAFVLLALTVGTAVASPGSGAMSFFLTLEDGSFSALPPLCETGNAVDAERVVTDGLLSRLRRFNCDGGGDSVIARVWVLGSDSEWGLEEGAWQIIEGAGDFTRLRGKGTYARVLLGDGAVSEVWRGVVDYDDIPPQVALYAISLKKRPDNSHVVRVFFSARDSFGGPVSYLVAARSSVLLAASYGIAREGTSSVTLHVRPRAGERRVRIEIEATDQVGNVRTVVRARSVRGAS